MRHDRKQLHRINSFFRDFIMNKPEKKHQTQTRNTTKHIMLLLVLILMIIGLTGCEPSRTLNCGDYSVTLSPGNCEALISIRSGGVPGEDALCIEGQSFVLREWWLGIPLPEIYTENISICATDNVPEYTKHSVGYGVFGKDDDDRKYFGGAKFIITSPGSGSLRVAASAVRETIPFGDETRLLADVGGGTGPDFTFSWLPGDSLDDPSAQNPYASPTVTTEYTVTVTDSAGAFASDTVTVTVNLGVFVSASPNPISIGETSTLNVTAGGGTPPYTYTYETSDGIILCNTNCDQFLVVSPSVTTNYIVTVTDDVGDTATGNATVTVNPPPGFQVIKFSIPDTLKAGHTFKYQIIVKNIGLGIATGVSLTDSLPPDEVTLDIAPVGCMSLANEINCNLNNLAPGESTVVTIDATVKPGVSGTIDNTVYVNSNETGEISDTWTSNVCPETANCFDLSIVKTATTLTTIGGNVRYGLSVANVGPDEATDVIVIDHLPTGFEFDPLNSSPACSAVCSTVTCSLGNYASGDSELVIIEATVTPQASPGTNVNTATVVSSVAQDPFPDNNSSSDSTNVIVNPSDLEITLIAADPPATINPGDPSHLAIFVLGGNQPYSFLWTADPQSGNTSDGGIASGDETLQFPWVTPLSPTEYTVVVTDASGNTASASVRVSIGFTVWADADPTDIIFGDSSQLFATVVGGVDPYTYAWGCAGLNFCDIVNPIAIPDDDTEYQVFVFDNIGNFTSHSVNVNVAMIVTVLAVPEVINSGGQAELFAQVQGGSFPYNFQWTPANGLAAADENKQFPVVNPTVSTTYEMTVTDSNGKVGTECVHVQVIPP